MEIYALGELYDAYDEPQRKELKKKINGFCCKSEAVGAFLKQNALRFDRHHIARTYLLFASGRLEAYFTIALGSIDKDNIAPMIKERLAPCQTPNKRREIATLRLCQLAKQENSTIEGDALMTSVLQILYSIHRSIGGYLIELDALKVESIRALYARHGFIEIDEGEQSIKMMHYIASSK